MSAVPRLEPLPPEDAIRYFEAKGYRITGDWREMWQAQHAKNFTVAHCARLDILRDIRQAIAKSVQDGGSYQEFQAQLEPILKAKGWWGRKFVTHPDGTVEKITEGTPWRLRTIFETNLQTAYGAGRFKAQMEDRDVRPLWMYDAVMDSRTRPLHAAMDGKIFPADDPFWDENYPPNGYRCRCGVIALTAGEAGQLGKRPGSTVDPATGEIRHIPVADPAWAFNPGQAAWRGVTAEFSDDPRRWVPVGPDLPGNKIPLAEVPERHIERIRREQLLEDPALPPAERVQRFLAEFGAGIGRPVGFTDAIGDRIGISDELFVNRKLTAETGRTVYKSDKRGRGPYMIPLARALKDPYEIWLQEGRDEKGRPTLYKTYIKLFHVEGAGAPTPGLAAFKWDGRQWTGETIFAPDAMKYLESQRKGKLLYRREDASGDRHPSGG